MRYFDGMEMQEIAGMLGISQRTVEREWRAARAWLGDRLGA
jgi:DNA-directed RNA polymerase specialized sigma24 family protein